MTRKHLYLAGTILAAVAGAVAIVALTRAKTREVMPYSVTRNNGRPLAHAVVEWLGDEGTPPVNVNSLLSRCQSDSDAQACRWLIERNIEVDGWGTPFLYLPERVGETCDGCIKSAGPDRRAWTEDDLDFSYPPK
jgi:hypothetical protein